jgi:HTH-type transcriptional regulator/antitoxin HigA
MCGWILDSTGQTQQFHTSRAPPLLREKIKEFAATNSVHPGIVVGQLQHRGEISYAHSRNMLVRVREIVTRSSLTDGRGYVPMSIILCEREALCI